MEISNKLILILPKDYEPFESSASRGSVTAPTFGLPPCSRYSSHETVCGVSPGKGRRHGDPLAPVSDRPDTTVQREDVGEENLHRDTLVQSELCAPPSANAKQGDPLASREIFIPTIESRVTNAHRP